MIYTADTAAVKIGVSSSKIRKECKKLGIPKFGKNYIIEDLNLVTIKNTIKPRGRKKRVTSDK